jgi:hypothetical protein
MGLTNPQTFFYRMVAQVSNVGSPGRSFDVPPTGVGRVRTVEDRDQLRNQVGRTVGDADLGAGAPRGRPAEGFAWVHAEAAVRASER